MTSHGSVSDAFETFCSRTNSYKNLGPLYEHLAVSYKAHEFRDLQWLSTEAKVLIPKPQQQKKKKKKSKTRAQTILYEDPKDVKPDNYLHLHAYYGKICPYKQSKVSTASVEQLLSGTFDSDNTVDEAMEFIRNNNCSLVVTRRRYTSKNNFVDIPVAILCFTGPEKSVLYVGWAAVSKGQLMDDRSASTGDSSYLPSPRRDSENNGYIIPKPLSGKAIPDGFDRLGLTTVLVQLMFRGTSKFRKMTTPYTFLHCNPSPTLGVGALPFWKKMEFGSCSNLQKPFKKNPKHPVEKNLREMRKYAELQQSVKAAVAELEEMFKVNTSDGLSSYHDEALLLMYRKHPYADEITLKPGLKSSNELTSNRPKAPPRRALLLQVVEAFNAREQMIEEIEQLRKSTANAKTAVEMAEDALKLARENLDAAKNEKEAINDKIQNAKEQLKLWNDEMESASPAGSKKAEQAIANQQEAVTKFKNHTNKLKAEAQKLHNQKVQAQKLASGHNADENSQTFSDSAATKHLLWQQARDAHIGARKDYETALKELKQMESKHASSQDTAARTSGLIDTMNTKMAEYTQTLVKINKRIDDEQQDVSTKESTLKDRQHSLALAKSNQSNKTTANDQLYQNLVKARHNYTSALPKDEQDGNLSDYSDMDKSDFANLTEPNKKLKIRKRRVLRNQLGLSAANPNLGPRTTYVTGRLPQVNPGHYYQHLGGSMMTDALYQNINPKTDGNHFSIRELVTRAHTYWEHNQTQQLTAEECLIYAQLDDVSFGINVDCNSYNREDDTVKIRMSVYKIPLLPKEPDEWMAWLENPVYDLEKSNLPDEWEHKNQTVTVYLEHVLRTANNERYELIMDLLFGTNMYQFKNMTAAKDGDMVTTWVEKPKREPGFLSPGSEYMVRLLPEDLFGKRGKSFMYREKNKTIKCEYDYDKQGDPSYIKSFGTYNDYKKATTAHVKRVQELGYNHKFIPPLPLYRYELAKFRWLPSKDNTNNDGYYEAMARIPNHLGKFVHVRVSVLNAIMENQMFADDDGKRFIRAIKAKACTTDAGFTARYRFVDLPPGNPRKKKKQSTSSNTLATASASNHEMSHTELRRLAAAKAMEAAAIAEEDAMIDKPAENHNPTLKRTVDSDSDQASTKKVRRTSKDTTRTDLDGMEQSTTSQFTSFLPPPPNLLTSIPIKFKQQQAPTCLLDSFCSGLWEFGMRDAAKGLQTNYRAQLTQNNVHLVGEWVSICNEYYLSRHGLTLRCVTQISSICDALTWESAWPLVLFLNTSDGATGQHSVTIVGNAIYEPNSDMALHKCLESLNWAGGDNCECTDIHKAYQVLPRKCGSLDDGPPTLYHVIGHGIGWRTNTKQQKMNQRTWRMQVQLLSGGYPMWVPTKKLVPLVN